MDKNTLIALRKELVKKSEFFPVKDYYIGYNDAILEVISMIDQMLQEAKVEPQGGQNE